MVFKKPRRTARLFISLQCKAILLLRAGNISPVTMRPAHDDDR
jgi:hypothetical protein